MSSSFNVLELALEFVLLPKERISYQVVDILKWIHKVVQQKRGFVEDTCLESAETESPSNGDKHFTFAEQHEVSLTFFGQFRLFHLQNVFFPSIF